MDTLGTQPYSLCREFVLFLEVISIECIYTMILLLRGMSSSLLEGMSPNVILYLHLMSNLWCDNCTLCHAVKLRDRVLTLIGRAYKNIRIADLCSLLGQSEDQVRQSKPL